MIDDRDVVSYIEFIKFNSGLLVFWLIVLLFVYEENSFGKFEKKELLL